MGAIDLTVRCYMTAPAFAATRTQLIDLIGNDTITPGQVFDMDLRLDEAHADEALDDRRAIKALLTA